MPEETLKSFKVTLYPHREKEDNWAIRRKFEKLGVNAEHEFRYVCQEIQIKAEVFEDGTCKALKINNVDVSDKEIWI